MSQTKTSLKGRGAAHNPKNRFERIEVQPNPLEEGYEPLSVKPLTQFYHDHSRSIISYNQSPDIGLGASLNPYRGCEHGCFYCYARPTHEYLGFSSGLDFETHILIKANAPQLLRKQLSAPSYKPQTLMFSGVTDLYQPIERKLQLTRACLKVLLEFRHPVSLITKNHLITRDLDVLQELAVWNCVSAALSITTLNDELRQRMEPRTSSASRRLAAVEALANANVPVGVMTAPIIPGLNDHEIPQLVQAAANAGAWWVGYTLVHLPYSTKELFVDWLQRHYPQRANKVIERLRSMRGGQLNDPRFGYRMRGQGLMAQQIAQLFKLWRKKAGLDKPHPALSTEHFRVPGLVQQPGLFE